MNAQPKCIAIELMLAVSLLLTFPTVQAQSTAASILQASGVLLAKSPQGAVKVLKPRSSVAVGDTLISQAKTYVQVKLVDESRLILLPGTTLTIEAMRIEGAGTAADTWRFHLAQGGVRLSASASAKASKHKVVMTSPAGKIDMEGASALVQYQTESATAAASRRAWLMASSAALEGGAATVDGPTHIPLAIRPLQLAQNANLPSNGLTPGLYVQVLDGMIHLTNSGGAQNFAAGQFGYVATMSQPPVILPANPGIQFSPPPSFSSSTATSGIASKSSSVNCEVR